MDNEHEHFGDPDDTELDSEIALLNTHQNNTLELGMEVHNWEESNFNSIAGTIARDKVPALRNILWRLLRGNLYFHDIPIDEEFPVNDKSTEMVYKNVFIIFIHGDVLRSRVRKIIQSLDGIIFDNASGNSEARRATLDEINDRIEELTNVVDSTKDQLITELKVFQELYPDYSYIVQREKLVYETLNKFDEDSTRRCLVGEGWIPSVDFEKYEEH